MSVFQAENLKENIFYEFQVRAMNMAGLSKASVPSAVLECKAWTITLPGTQKQYSILGKEEATRQRFLNVNITFAYTCCTHVSKCYAYMCTARGSIYVIGVQLWM